MDIPLNVETQYHDASHIELHTPVVFFLRKRIAQGISYGKDPILSAVDVRYEDW